MEKDSENKNIKSQPFDCVTDFIFVEHNPIKADIILIPGGHNAELMVKAVELYEQGLAPLILPSGGVNRKLPGWKNEWEFLRSIAIEKGVPERVILKEDQAHNTFDNARMSWEVINKQGLQIKKVLLVCKTYHSRRALLTYQTLFPPNIEFIVCPVVDEYNICKDNWFMQPEKIGKVMKEVGKIGQYFGNHIFNWSKE